MNERAQWLILLDAAVLGPYMVYTATQIENPYFRAGMMAAGIGAMLLNGFEWMRGIETRGFIGEKENATAIRNAAETQLGDFAPAVPCACTYRNPHRRN